MRYSSLVLPVLFTIALALLLQHFLGSLAWAGLLAVITWPLHERLQARGLPRMASASVPLALLVLCFVGPSLLLFKANLEKIGVQLELRPGPWGEIWDDAKRLDSAPNMISMTGRRPCSANPLPRPQIAASLMGALKTRSG